jgi:hypothetical protein
MSINASSTQQEIVGQYLDNLSYDMDGSVAKAKLFIAACRALLVMHPTTWSHAQSSIQFNPNLWEKQLQDAQRWLSSRVSQGNVNHMSFRGFRN